jgi:hypothetical protein
MVIQSMTDEEFQELKSHLRRLKTEYNTGHAQGSGFCVARVFFGVQPGDHIEYDSHAQWVPGVIERLAELNGNFRFESVEPHRIVFYNPPLVSPKLLSDFLYEERAGWDPFSRESVYGVGRFFGFPDCCINAWHEGLYYSDRGQRLQKFYSDESIADRSVLPFTEADLIAFDMRKHGFKVRTADPTKNHRDQLTIVYCEHWPCSPYCKESSEIALRYKPVVDFVASL